MKLKNILIILALLLILCISLSAVSAANDDNISVSTDDGNNTFKVSNNLEINESMLNTNLENKSVENNSNMMSINKSLDSDKDNNSNNEKLNNTINSTENNGIWVISSDMPKINISLMAKYTINNIFLNSGVFNNYNMSYITSWISTAKSYGINVHIWVPVFYNNSKWISPINSTGDYDIAFFDKKINEILEYAAITGVDGINLDYLRFPGTASKYKKGTEAINYFAKDLSAKLKAKYPNIVISAAVMPEDIDSDKKYYGQDIVTLSKYLDVLCPMAYKGNYGKNSSWINSVTKSFVSASTHANIWVGLQTYKSDSQIDKLSTSELYKDCRYAITGGAQGFVLFRYGLTNFFNFSTCYKDSTVLNASNMTITAYTSKNLTTTLKDANGNVLANKKVTFTFNGKTYTKTTDANGKAYLTISSSYVGSYPVTIKFAGDDNYKSASVTVTVKVNAAYVTISQIMSSAVNLNNYIFTHERVPSNVTVNGVKYTTAQFTYLLSVALKNLNAKKDVSTKIEIINVKASNVNYNIKINATKAQYLSVVNTIYSKGSSGTLPSYVSVGGKEAGFNAYVYALSRALAFYKNKERLPETLLFTSYF